MTHPLAAALKQPARAAKAKQPVATAMHWGAQEGIALLVVAALIVIAWALYRVARGRRMKAAVAAAQPGTVAQIAGADRGGLIMGFDKRVSTSKTIATLWTFVVAYMVLVILFVALKQSDALDFFSKTLGKASQLYLVFLGGPYAAAVIAKLHVTTNADVQKSDGDGQVHPADVITNDAGSIDLYDFQYTLFNLIAMFAMVIIFLGHPALGLPEVPGFLAALTGGAAAVYSANKVARTNPPTLTGMLPNYARVGEPVTLSGTNLLPDGATSGDLLITIGSPALATAPASTTDATQATFTVPALPPGTAWPTNPQKVFVTTPDNATTTDDKQLKIVPDEPHLDSLGVVAAPQGSKLTVTGQYFEAVGAGTPTPAVQLKNLAGNVVATIPAIANTRSGTQFEIALPGNLLAAGAPPQDFHVSVIRSGANPSNELPLTITT